MFDDSILSKFIFNSEQDRHQDSNSFELNIIIFQRIHTKIKSERVIRYINKLLLLRDEAMTFTTQR